MAVDARFETELPKVSFWNDPVKRGYIYQVALAAGLAVFFYWIAGNTASNLEAQNRSTGFDFLGFPSGFDIGFTLIEYDRASLYSRAFLVGVLNTLLVAVIGIVLATILGFIIGVARLSKNYIIRSLATVYVELLRNIPLLLQIIFWYSAVLKVMPNVKQSFVWWDAFVLNNREFYFPKPITDENFSVVYYAIAAAIFICYVVSKLAKMRLAATGKRFPALLTSIVILLALPVLAYYQSGAQLTFEYPELKGFNYKGGLSLPNEFSALLIGLVLYTAAFIAEIVRAGIQSVNKGQTEACNSLGLKNNDALRFVIIPQAMRVIIPPLTSQYLNLTKNSSLAAFIGYQDFVSIFMGTSLNQSGRAIEIVLITMLVYLTLSLSTAALMNWYNARMALAER